MSFVDNSRLLVDRFPKPPRSEAFLPNDVMKRFFRKVSTVAGTGEAGYQDGKAAEATFGGGMGICLDASGNIYVADFYNQCIRKIGTDGMVTTVAGVPGQWGHKDGDGTTAMFSAPTHLCVDKDGNLIIADVGNGGGSLTGEGFIRKITFNK